jgi:hypothetical protein
MELMPIRLPAHCNQVAHPPGELAPGAGIRSQVAPSCVAARSGHRGPLGPGTTVAISISTVLLVSLERVKLNLFVLESS